MTCQSCPRCHGFCGVDGAVMSDGCICLDPWVCDNHDDEEER